MGYEPFILVYPYAGSLHAVVAFEWYENRDISSGNIWIFDNGELRGPFLKLEEITSTKIHILPVQRFLCV